MLVEQIPSHQGQTYIYHINTTVLQNKNYTKWHLSKRVENAHTKNVESIICNGKNRFENKSISIGKYPMESGTKKIESYLVFVNFEGNLGKMHRYAAG